MATNPRFTVAFDLASSDDDYGAFLAGIREKLGNPRHVSHNRPVLPPVEPGAPRRWFHVLLRTPASTLTLATRADNLYLAGFRSADGTWWELSHGTTLPWRRQPGLIAGAMPLGFSGTYHDLVGGKRQLANVALGRRQMADAVDALAALTAASGLVSGSNQSQTRLAKDTLVVLLLIVHEATRFLDVAAVVTGLMRPDAADKSGRTTRTGKSSDLGWRYWSWLLLSADSPPLMPAGIGEVPPAPLNKNLVKMAEETVGIILFVDVEKGIKADKALRLFHGNMCGNGRDGAGTDVTFLVSGESIAAHRYVLAGKSAVFLRQLIGRRERKKTTPAEVKDMDAATFRAMVHYIYTDTVPEFDDRRRRSPEEDEAVATMAYHLHVAAERYELERLKLICKRKLQSGAIYVAMAARTLALAKQHGYRRLKAKCIDFIVGTPETLHAVLETEGYKHLEASYPSVLTELLKSVHGHGRNN